jgi:tRNA-dihydrouridine synthase A
MREPELVADCVRAMRATVDIPVTVKHRIGLDRDDSYHLVQRFVESVAAAGCDTFIVHARNAWLSGLSPKENREVPALRYDVVARLRREFPGLKFVLNGGISSVAAAIDAIEEHGTVMIGRLAYHEPYALAEIEHALYGTPLPSRSAVVLAMTDYLEQYLQVEKGAEVRHVVRHMLGLFHGLPAARVWRRQLSDSRVLAHATSEILKDALAAMQLAAARNQVQSIFPGFINPRGSSAALI